jgi:hypothetical protein
MFFFLDLGAGATDTAGITVLNPQGVNTGFPIVSHHR